MKSFIAISFLTCSISFIACNDNPSKRNDTATPDSSRTTVTNNKSKIVKQNTAYIHDLISGYLNLKNALAADQGKAAASAAEQIGTAISKIEESDLTQEEKKIYEDVKDDIKEHAEHIAANGSNIKHQREHFDVLSKDLIDLVKETGSAQTLYKDFCPMYNNKKGAYWLSESKEIKNPYYGKQMPKCGELKEEINPKY